MVNLRLALIVVGVLLTGARTTAHHSVVVEFDPRKPITVTGVVTRVEWTNPHVRFYIDVKEDGGRSTAWSFEAGGTAGLMRQGWTRTSLKTGDKVSVSGFRSRKLNNVVAATTVITSTGQKLFAGTPKE